MKVSSPPRWRRLISWIDLAFMLWAALFLGALGGISAKLMASLAGAAVLVGSFGAYDRILPANTGLKRGLFAGMVLGASVGTVGLILGGSIEDVRSGAVLGTLLGIMLGGVIGTVSRAEFDEGEGIIYRLFLLVGSVALGALLAGTVGLFVGVFIGLTRQMPYGGVLSILAGIIVGLYMGASYQTPRAVWLGGVSGGVITAVSLWLGGAFAGLVVGAIAGCLTPMLFVALIGAVGGLTARGPKAMIVEALEAPSEILAQGAVPFLLPAVITGAIVGTSGSGPGGLVIITAALALLGMLFGAFGDFNGRSGQQVTFRSVVEVAMMGSDEWPVRQVVQQVTGPGRRRAVGGALLGVGVGLAGSAAGYVLVEMLLRVW
jgi:hypothetical protein